MHFKSIFLFTWTPLRFLGMAITFKNVAGLRLLDSKNTFLASTKHFSQLCRWSAWPNTTVIVSTRSLQIKTNHLFDWLFLFPWKSNKIKSIQCIKRQNTSIKWLFVGVIARRNRWFGVVVFSGCMTGRLISCIGIIGTIRVSTITIIVRTTIHVCTVGIGRIRENRAVRCFVKLSQNTSRYFFNALIQDLKILNWYIVLKNTIG